MTCQDGRNTRSRSRARNSASVYAHDGRLKSSGEDPVMPQRYRAGRGNGSVLGARGLAVLREVGRQVAGNRRGDDRAVAHAIDELRHVVVERGVLLVQRNALLQETDAGAEVVADQRFEAALERLQRGVLVELFERLPDLERVRGLRHREVEQAELEAREMELRVDVESAAHLQDGFRIFTALGELGTEQVTQLGVARIAGDGGTQSRDLWRIHGHRLKEVSASIAQGFRLVWDVFRVMQSALRERPAARIPTTTPDSQRPIRDIARYEWLGAPSGRCAIHREKCADNAV